MREVEPSEAYKLKYPEQVVMVSAYASDGRANSMAAGWSMIASGEPRLHAVAIGKSRYTMECIDARGAFVISSPSVRQRKAVLFCGSNSGRDVDKEKESGFAFLPATRVDAPLIEGAVVNLECALAQKHDCGDHYIVVGEVLAAHIQDGRQRLYNFGSGVLAGARKA